VRRELQKHIGWIPHRIASKFIYVDMQAALFKLFMSSTVTNGIVREHSTDPVVCMARDLHNEVKNCEKFVSNTSTCS
jgi:hypothetical protein